MSILPDLYHAHHSAHPEDLPFWLDLAHRYGSPLLELGCGSGRLTQPLTQAGFQVTGLDHDRHMLLFLKRTASAAGWVIPVFQANMAEFHLAARFSLILLPCNTLSSLDERDRVRMFNRVAAHLSQTGVFVASLPNPALLADLPRRGPEEVEDEFYHPLTGDPVQVSSAWRRTKRSFDLTWHYDLLHADGQVERFSITTIHTLQPLQAYVREMEQAGLSLLATWGDFDLSDYENDSPSLILMAGLSSPAP
jgi:SAM-dependent methyltransferase